MPLTSREKQDIQISKNVRIAKQSSEKFNKNSAVSTCLEAGRKNREYQKKMAEKSKEQLNFIPTVPQHHGLK